MVASKIISTIFLVNVTSRSAEKSFCYCKRFLLTCCKFLKDYPDQNICYSFEVKNTEVQRVLEFSAVIRDRTLSM